MLGELCHAAEVKSCFALATQIGSTVLILAAAGGSLDMVRLVIEYGADLEAENTVSQRRLPRPAQINHTFARHRSCSALGAAGAESRIFGKVRR